MTDDKDQTQPLYLGHRARLRSRFMADNGESMPDYELLELLLTMSIPRRDVKPLAKELIIKFKDIGGVINAPVSKLLEINGISENTATMIKLVSACGLRAASESFSDNEGPIIVFWGDFIDYCRQLMAYKEVEEFRVFFFDDKLQFKRGKLMNTGTINKAYVHPREIIRAAIEYKATKIVLAHNHPSGESKPSKTDYALTDEIAMVAEAMDIEVFDHIIVTRNSVFSFRNAGLIKDPKD